MRQSFERNLSVSDDGPSRERDTDNPWRDIREFSVLHFVKKVARLMGGEDDRQLRGALTRSALFNGMAVTFRGSVYQPDTQLRLFGKPEVVGKRRMGVALALGKDLEAARAKARKAAEGVKLG